jgi:aspartyl-tRNA(Asn)/glutamyl-tRNA(Gln) amidotransferase subunit B
MEIVSKADIRSSEQAKAYVPKLRSILRYLGTCDGDMEKGSLRADSQRVGAQAGRAARHALRDQEHELDQLHRRAIEHEARRQIEIIEDGGTIEQETRLYDPGKARDALDALQGGGARPIAISPIPDLAAARADAGRGRSR